MGVCLGHQAIGDATGGQIVRARRLMHGKVDQIHHHGRGLFVGLPNPFAATRYHSLVIEPGTLSDDYEITAWSELPEGGQEIMAVQHKRWPVYGLQFHPESFLTLVGSDILRRFLEVRPPIETGRCLCPCRRWATPSVRATRLCEFKPSTLPSSRSKSSMELVSSLVPLRVPRGRPYSAADSEEGDSPRPSSPLDTRPRHYPCSPSPKPAGPSCSTAEQIRRCGWRRRIALGLVLAEEITSDIDSPPFDKSMVDGYAVRSADLISNGDGELEVIEEIAAGATAQKAGGPGQCWRIMTGAPIPAGADAVVMHEHTQFIEPGV